MDSFLPRFDEGDKVQLTNASPHYKEAAGLVGTISSMSYSYRRQQWRYAVIFPLPWSEGREEYWATVGEQEIAVPKN
jgi:hypothetical protein